MKHKLTIIAACVCLAAPLTALCEDSPKPEDKVIRFTSTPDIFNWNISNPQPGWEETITWFLDRLQKEGPDFTLHAGDVMDARWWDSPDQVTEKTNEYWTGFMKRFKDRGMTIYIAPGDHEYGDDGGLKIGDISRAFAGQFTKIFDMPKNGPETNLGRAFWVREGNLLIVTLDTFVDRGDHFGYTVNKEQLAWLDKVLTDQADADFVIVQGHLPIIGPVRTQNSSASMLEEGTDSELWKIMVKHGVDVYLTGEHHRITVSKEDGIWQVVHGALWGTQPDLNYLRGVVTPDSLTLELVEFDVQYGGDFIGNHEHRSERNRPREKIELTEYARTFGPRVVGKLVLKKGTGGKAETQDATGWFQVPTVSKQK
ncbi:MAG: metallophosphoesterase [Terrimicrobiaceae bacterium]